MAFELSRDGHAVRVRILQRRPQLVIAVDGDGDADRGAPGMRVEVTAAALSTPSRGAVDCVFDGQPVRLWRYVNGDEIHIRLAGRTFSFRRADRMSAEAGQGGADELRADMPGTVVAIHRAPGDPVVAGERVLTIESMKLQMPITAPRDGTVAAIHVGENGTFESGAVLMSLAPLENLSAPMQE